ncbi:S41 family peptidase [Fulvivirgaceae bacterium BMA10]|uniref:S41 family peptidase n=1 Tax=Splendidivirga corallicola TaxID=3051826 RepID=A0ABT8KHZ2_9BACT|nr:S41 family peptidase [Fulvivirgaceae bacterium BMA10]
MRTANVILFCSIFLLTACKDDECSTMLNAVTAFEQVWNDFDQTYAYFELKDIDWDSLYNANSSNINEETTFDELESILAQVTLSLRDLHVRFIGSNKTYQFRKRDQFLDNSPENAVNYLSDIIFDNNRVVLGNIQSTNIAYVRIKRLGGMPADYTEFSTIFQTLPTKDALILDVRENGGGNDAVGKAFAERLTMEERIYEYVRFRNGTEHHDFNDWTPIDISPSNPVNFDKPIILLTNRGCYSSAESFVLMIKTLPNVTQVGDTTGGATGNPKIFSLSNGWKYYISSWQAATIDFQLIEDHGIAPDVVVNNTEETFNDGRDLILEKAIELLD